MTVHVAVALAQGAGYRDDRDSAGPGSLGNAYGRLVVDRLMVEAPLARYDDICALQSVVKADGVQNYVDPGPQLAA